MIDLIHRTLEVGKCELPDLREPCRLIPPRLDVVCRKHDGLQKAHIRLSKRVEVNGGQNLRILDPEAGTGVRGAVDAVNHLRSPQHILRQRHTVLRARLQELLVRKLLRTVMHESRELRLMQIHTIAHRETDTGEAHTQRMLIARRLQHLLQLRTDLQDVLQIGLSVPRSYMISHSAPFRKCSFSCPGGTGLGVLCLHCRPLRAALCTELQRYS